MGRLHHRQLSMVRLGRGPGPGRLSVQDKTAGRFALIPGYTSGWALSPYPPGYARGFGL